MSELNKIQLKQSSILGVPFQIYDKDFIFMVNGEQFKTSRFISDLLSPTISSIHQFDPTLNIYIINTQTRGNFSLLLDLLTFKEIEIPETEFPFILEVINFLGNENIELHEPFQTKELNIDNIFTLIEKHQKYHQIFSKSYTDEINFISSHFYEICEVQNEKLLQLGINTLRDIIDNENLQIETEDQLLNFINKLYSNDSKYSFLYEYVYFSNVSSEMIKEFIKIYDINDLTSETWIRLCERLEQDNDKINNNDLINKNRYKNKKEKKLGIVFEPSNGELNGIIKYLYQNSSKNINQEINVTASSLNCNSQDQQPQNVLLFNDNYKCFISGNEPNSWIKLDFKEHRIIPTHYTIRTAQSWAVGNGYYPKDWVIECSNDENKWDIVDTVTNCPYFNGNGVMHTFKINHQINNKYKCIRMKLTGLNTSNNNHLIIESFEIFGTFI